MQSKDNKFSSSDSSSDESREDFSEEDSSIDDSSSIESKEEAQLFTVVGGECPGDVERITLLSSKEIRTLNTSSFNPKMIETIYKGIFIRAEAESTEDEPWITAFFSLVPYTELVGCMYNEVNSKIKKLEGWEDLRVLVSTRFVNVPDDVIYEMYSAIPSFMSLEKDEKILFLSTEVPIHPLEEKEILRVFPNINLKKMRNLFPIYAEEVFLTLDNVLPAFTAHASGNAIKGFLLDKKTFSSFISSLSKYFDE